MQRGGGNQRPQEVVGHYCAVVGFADGGDFFCNARCRRPKPTSGRKYWGPPCSNNSRNSHIDTKRSPLPKGTVDFCAMWAWVEMLSIWDRVFEEEDMEGLEGLGEG